MTCLEETEICTSRFTPCSWTGKRLTYQQSLLTPSTQHVHAKHWPKCLKSLRHSYPLLSLTAEDPVLQEAEQPSGAWEQARAGWNLLR